MSLITNQIVGRLHVSATKLDVCRAIRAALKPHARTSDDYREDRRMLYAAGLEQHKDNQDLYAYVMRGGF